MRRQIFALSALCILLSALSLFAETKTPIDGYSGVTWGAAMPDVRKAVKGQIIFDDEKRLIVSRDGDITYRYGFFYKEPLKKAAAADASNASTPPANTQGGQGAAAVPSNASNTNAAPAATAAATTEAVQGESKLLYVITEFPYIPLEEIKAKMVGAYGAPTGDTVVDAQGAVIWDSGKGVAIAWVDAYEKKPFVRRITYVGKNLAKELNEYVKSVFNKKEADVINSMVP